MAPVPRARHSRDYRRSLVAGLARGALAAAVAVVVVTATAGAVLLRQLDGNIREEDVLSTMDNRPEQDPESAEALNILLIGSDSRDIAGGERYGGTASTPGLSDTTILLHLAADRSRATFVSIPRDSMVDIPSCPMRDGSTAAARFDQFNSAYATGGAACTISTVESLTGIYIDHFAVIDFIGFEQAVDAIGGVPVCLSEAVRDRYSGLDLPAGEQRLTGPQALAYVRARHIGDGSDLERIERQQAFMSSAVQEATSTGVLLRPDRLLGVLDAATRSLTTDPGLSSISALTSLATSVRNLPPEQMTFLTVPIVPYAPDENRVEWGPDAAVLWDALRFDQPIPGVEDTPSADASSTEASPEASAPDSASPTPTIDPAEVRVRVRNTGAPQGAAAETAEALAALGFDVLEAGNGDLPSTGVTVWAPPGGEAAAESVAAAFNAARVSVDETLPAGSAVVVALGAGAGQVSQSSGAVSGPGAVAEPSVDARRASDDICAP